MWWAPGPCHISRPQQLCVKPLCSVVPCCAQFCPVMPCIASPLPSQGGAQLAQGQALLGRVLDVSKAEGIVDLSMDPKHVAAGRKAAETGKPGGDGKDRRTDRGMPGPGSRWSGCREGVLQPGPGQVWVLEHTAMPATRCHLGYILPLRLHPAISCYVLPSPETATVRCALNMIAIDQCRPVSVSAANVKHTNDTPDVAPKPIAQSLMWSLH